VVPEDAVEELVDPIAVPSFWRSDYAAARSNLQKTLSLYNAAEHGSHVFVYGQDPAACAQMFDAWSLWLWAMRTKLLRRLSGR
jgi:hypothetical protein